MSSATIKSKDFEIELPVVEGSENEKAIDITSLRSKTGYITLDPGYANTGSCKSSITFNNGEKGILRYRGYNIEELAKKSDFIEVANLLIYGDLPNKSQHLKYKKLITRHTLLHDQIINFLCWGLYKSYGNQW